MKVPCQDCLVFIRCKQYIHKKHPGGVSGLVRQQKCPMLARYLIDENYNHEATETAINKARIVFGLHYENLGSRMSFKYLEKTIQHLNNIVEGE